ncbi:c-type cytochrome [Bacillus rubiinfantis]|uniref:c-type cytochrome n=1 Tax=Bacillus rubiinfantis TaxID=1499680 RepID=UPI000693FE1A|nr:c-type cytochrome [Bacillus rubiinfantis]
MRILKFSNILLIFMMVVFSGCAKTEEKENTSTVSKQEKTADLDKRLAGGQLGSDSIAFIGGGNSNKVWVADAKYHKLISMIDMGGPKPKRTKNLYPDLNDTHAITFSKDFKTAYTVDWFNYDQPSQVIAFDPVSFKELWRAPAGKGGHHSALSPDDKYLYVANEHGGTISVIDTQSRKKIKDLPTGKGPDYITPSMYWEGKVINSPYLWASIDQENKVIAIDWKTNEIVKEIPVDGMMHGINLTPDGKQVWVCVMGAKNITIIDVDSMKVKKKLPFKESPIHLSFSPDGNYAYLAAGGNEKQLFKLSTKDYKTKWNSTATSIPGHTGISPDGKELWTLNHGMDTKRYPYNLGEKTLSGVQIWDTDNGELINEIPAEGMPHEIQFVPYSAVGKIPAQSHPEDAKGKAGNDESSKANSVDAQAQEIYNRSCMQCHAADLSGKDGPNLQKVGSRMTEDELYKQIKNGKGMMPSGLVSDKEAKILAEWLAKQK